MPHLGDYGLKLVVDTHTDLSDVEEAYILCKPPRSELRMLPATINGTTLEADIPPNFFDQDGHWLIQALVVGVGFRLTGDIAKLYVGPRLE